MTSSLIENDEFTWVGCTELLHALLSTVESCCRFNPNRCSVLVKPEISNCENMAKATLPEVCKMRVWASWDNESTKLTPGWLWHCEHLSNFAFGTGDIPEC
jgi:hypothetical protein